MITINKNMKWDSMIPGDWDVTPGITTARSQLPAHQHYRKSGFVDMGGYDPNYTTGTWAENGYGIKGQGAWVLASFTQAEIDYIMNNSNASYQVSIGTFPMMNQFLLPTMTTDASGNTLFEFKDKCVIEPYALGAIQAPYPQGITYNQTAAGHVSSLSAYSGNGKTSKYKVPSTYTGHSAKSNFTHLVYVFGRAYQNDFNSSATVAMANGVVNSGQMYIDTRQFAAFTVGLEGSGADIIMSDTAIVPGKSIFFGNTDDTKIVVSMTSTLTVQ